MELFNSSELSSYFECKMENLKREINALSDKEILLVDKDEWKEYYVNEYSLEAVQVYEERITYDIKQEIIESYDSYSGRHIKTEGYQVKFYIPFDGNADVLCCRPSHFHSVVYRMYGFEEPTEEREGKFTFLFQYRSEEISRRLDDLKEFLFNRFENYYKDIRIMISYINNDIEEFNKSLPARIETWLKTRKEKADEWVKVTQKLQIPLVLDAAAPNVVPMALKKRVKKIVSKPSLKPQSPEYYIGDGDYDNIVNIINSCCMAMEQSASTFNKLEEEELRDFITAMLNSHYVDAVTGETFRRRGRTDILITFENAEAFIGECKVWHGVKLLGEALEQLLCYTTWRDLKTAIVIFNKVNKNFDNIQRQTEQWIAKKSKSWKRRNGNVWDCVIYSDFHGHDIKVAVCLYDITVKELPSSKKLIK